MEDELSAVTLRLKLIVKDKEAQLVQQGVDANREKEASVMRAVALKGLENDSLVASLRQEMAAQQEMHLLAMRAQGLKPVRR